MLVTDNLSARLEKALRKMLDNQMDGLVGSLDETANDINDISQINRTERAESNEGYANSIENDKTNSLFNELN